MENHPIYIVGKGNLGWHLDHLFKIKEIECAGWISSRASLDSVDFSDGSIIFLTVTDNLIESQVCKILDENKHITIVYCSGSIDIVSKYPNYVMCWYPLYSFTKGIPVDWDKVPIFTEIQNASISYKIQEINKKLNFNSIEISAEERKKLHLSAVFMNNFTTACAVAANTVLDNSKLFSYLMPILNQTVEKIMNFNGDELVSIQTGPAKRRDTMVILEHLELLKSLVPEHQLYDAVSKYIQQKIQ